jgi:hypothetical protein
MVLTANQKATLPPRVAFAFLGSGAYLRVEEGTQMPSRETVDAFVTQVASGDHIGAIRDWYAEDASMQENQSAPRAGRANLMAHEAKALARSKRVETELLGPPIIDGDRVVIRWRFTFIPREDGAEPRTMEELACQTWRGDKIVTETFFYDPKQIAR